eukprot:CAMPEP_0198644912 /NCGR_PEP_ID=MMETSP1467-20131203/926_1 /TAXON_ID=1462469 /ORGANISM="unid. sp., Strain CCMP2135" /LENGTH=78 /DNA_ID=CAMNT_0044380381 /DNA_START=47 /DNA_END=283 /DNA_ORIENTATION=-
MKVFSALAVLGSAAAFSTVPPMATRAMRPVMTFSEPELGKGGMADPRAPEPFKNEDDPRQSISAAPSFEEYLKSRANE